MAWATVLRPIWGGVLRIPHVRMLGAYNGALASGLRVWLRVRLRVLDRRPSSPYICGGLGYIA
jgi:hypothetical protein